MTLCMLDSFDDVGGLNSTKYSSAGGNTVAGGGRSGSPSVASSNWNALAAGNTGFRNYVRYFLPATQEDDVVIVGVAVNTSFFANAVQDLIVFSGDNTSTFTSNTAPATTHITVAYKDTATGFAVYRGTSSGTLLGSFKPALVGGWMYVEARVKLHDTLGEVQVRIDEVTVINLTGIDTKNAGTASVINGVDLVMSNGGGQGVRLDDLYICNEQGADNNTFLGNIRVELLRPNGTGAAAAWAGSDGDSVNNYVLVADESSGVGSLNTATYLTSSVVDDKDLHTYEDSQFNVGRPVKGVMMSCYAMKGDNNARSFRMVAHDVGGSEAETADQTLLANIYNVYTQIWERTPAGALWTVALVNGAQFGVKTR